MGAKHHHPKPAAAGEGGARGAAAPGVVSRAHLWALLTFALGWASRHFAADAPIARPRAADTARRRAEEAAREDPWERSTHPHMGRDGFNWTQLSMSRDGNFPPTGHKQYTTQMLEEKGAMWLWHTTYARSIPATIDGLAHEYAERYGHWTLDDFRREWGEIPVMTAFSPDVYFQRGLIKDPALGRRLQAPHRQKMSFAEFIDASRTHGEREHVAINQSPSRDFAEFGLPPLPPLLEQLVGPTLNARNFWAGVPPKISTLHYDWQDSLLLQISGSKRFTIVDPARLHTAYPAVFLIDQLVRTGPGQFESRPTAREIDNFPLVNVTHPDYERHPLFRDARVMTIDVPAGSALVLPAYWYHQVESFAPPGGLNVAVNYWFQGHSLATRLYRTLRENTFINCTMPPPPGKPDVCRDSLL